jgi:hypothetical protein
MVCVDPDAAVLALDCEMCGTQDPVSREQDHKALIRLSVINGLDEKEVVMDTLVLPTWPVVDYRSDIHGVQAKDLRVGIHGTSLCVSELLGPRVYLFREPRRPTGPFYLNNLCHGGCPCSQTRSDGVPQNCQFTLRHAQAAMLQVCCEETVLIGHAIDNDLVSAFNMRPTSPISLAPQESSGASARIHLVM